MDAGTVYHEGRNRHNGRMYGGMLSAGRINVYTSGNYNDMCFRDTLAFLSHGNPRIGKALAGPSRDLIFGRDPHQSYDPVYGKTATTESIAAYRDMIGDARRLSYTESPVSDDELDSLLKHAQTLRKMGTLSVIFGDTRTNRRVNHHIIGFMTDPHSDKLTFYDPKVDTHASLPTRETDPTHLSLTAINATDGKWTQDRLLETLYPASRRVNIYIEPRITEIEVFEGVVTDTLNKGFTENDTGVFHLSKPPPIPTAMREQTIEEAKKASAAWKNMVEVYEANKAKLRREYEKRIENGRDRRFSKMMLDDATEKLDKKLEAEKNEMRNEIKRHKIDLLNLSRQYVENKGETKPSMANMLHFFKSHPGDSGPSGTEDEEGDEEDEVYGALKGLKGYGMHGNSDTDVAHEMAIQAKSENPTPSIGSYTLVDSTPTVKSYADLSARKLVVSIRGTRPTAAMDISAVYSLVHGGNLVSSDRYKMDRESILLVKHRFPGFSVYATGHSLGGAIADLLIKEGVVESATTFNPAVEIFNEQSSKNRRIYKEGDPLLNLLQIGAPSIAETVEIRKNPQPHRILPPLLPTVILDKLAAHRLTDFHGDVVHEGRNRRY